MGISKFLSKKDGESAPVGHPPNPILKPVIATYLYPQPSQPTYIKPTICFLHTPSKLTDHDPYPLIFRYEASTMRSKHFYLSYKKIGASNLLQPHLII